MTCGSFGVPQLGDSATSNQGAIYDPKADTWTLVSPPTGWTSIGDALGVVLADGTFMLGNCCTVQAALLDPHRLTWTPVGTGKFDTNNEEGWTLLPSGDVSTVDAYVPITIPYNPTGTNSEIFTPASGTWQSAGSTHAQLWDSWLNCGELSLEPKFGPTFEVGPSHDLVSTHFDVPRVQETGPSELVVVANGIPSQPVPVFVRGDDRETD